MAMTMDIDIVQIIYFVILRQNDSIAPLAETGRGSGEEITGEVLIFYF